MRLIALILLALLLPFSQSALAHAQEPERFLGSYTADQIQAVVRSHFEQHAPEVELIPQVQSTKMVWDEQPALIKDWNGEGVAQAVYLGAFSVRIEYKPGFAPDPNTNRYPDGKYHSSREHFCPLLILQEQAPQGLLIVALETTCWNRQISSSGIEDYLGYESRFDFAPYQISAAERAFGLVYHDDNRGKETGSKLDTLLLFRRRGEHLDKILQREVDHIDRDHPRPDVGYQSTLAMSPSQTGGFFDIKVTRRTWLGPEEQNPRLVKTSRFVLRWDGQRYAAK